MGGKVALSASTRDRRARPSLARFASCSATPVQRILLVKYEQLRRGGLFALQNTKCVVSACVGDHTGARHKLSRQREQEVSGLYAVKLHWTEGTSPVYDAGRETLVRKTRKEESAALSLSVSRFS